MDPCSRCDSGFRNGTGGSWSRAWRRPLQLLKTSQVSWLAYAPHKHIRKRCDRTEFNRCLEDDELTAAQELAGNPVKQFVDDANDTISLARHMKMNA